MADLEFRRDLFQGTARDYDRFRVPYPRSLIDDLAVRSGATGRGRLLDLACGTGQVTFALASRFGEVWAVDQEPDMTSLVRQKARSAGLGHIRVLTSAAEDLQAPEGFFDLVAIGNAFHRLPRAAVAASAQTARGLMRIKTLLFDYSESGICGSMGCCRKKPLSYGARIFTNLRGGFVKSNASASGEFARASLALNRAKPSWSSVNFKMLPCS